MARTWQKNLRLIPPQIVSKVNSFNTDSCVVSCAVKIDGASIQGGDFNHLGMRWDAEGLHHPDRIVPDEKMGIYSRRNRRGYEIVFKDLPKVTKSWSIESPNYGDGSKGYHEVEFSRDVYLRKFIAPKLLSVRIELIGQDAIDQAYVFAFTVEEILDRKDSSFEDNLLFNLNLLQENIGNHDVQESEVSLSAYLQTLYINWEILPPGEREETINLILSGSRSQDPRIREMVTDRYDFLTSLKPKNYVKGLNEFRRYFGAQFADDLVVFENLEYGNAIYVMYDDWEDLSKKSRTELLSSDTANFDRILHTRTWKRRLRRLIRGELSKRQQTSS